MNRSGLFVAVLAALTTLPAVAQNMRFLAQSPVAYFNDQDMKIFHETGKMVLDTLPPGQMKAWSNPATGAQGRIKVLSAFSTADGRPCKGLGVYNEIRGIQSESKMTLCKFPDRGWLVDPDASPKPAQ